MSNKNIHIKMQKKVIKDADQDANNEADQYAILCRPSQPSAQIRLHPHSEE